MEHNSLLKLYNHYSDCGLVSNATVNSRLVINNKFSSKILPLSSEYKMEAAYSSENLVTAYENMTTDVAASSETEILTTETPLHHNLKGSDLNIHQCEKNSQGDNRSAGQEMSLFYGTRGPLMCSKEPATLPIFESAELTPHP